MKRRIGKVFLIIIIAYLLFWCMPHIPSLLMGIFTPGNISTAKVDIGSSDRFSPLEIRLAMNSAFSEVFGYGGTLTRVWYDEARSIAEFGETDTNQIKIYCDFITSEQIDYAGFESGELYDGWSILLRRTNRFCPWFKVDSGYA